MEGASLVSCLVAHHSWPCPHLICWLQIELIEKLVKFCAGQEAGLEWQGSMWRDMFLLLLSLLMHYDLVAPGLARDGVVAVDRGEYDDDDVDVTTYAD